MPCQTSEPFASQTSQNVVILGNGETCHVRMCACGSRALAGYGSSCATCYAAEHGIDTIHPFHQNNLIRLREMLRVRLLTCDITFPMQTFDDETGLRMFPTCVIENSDKVVMVDFVYDETPDFQIEHFTNQYPDTIVEYRAVVGLHADDPDVSTNMDIVAERVTALLAERTQGDYSAVWDFNDDITSDSESDDYESICGYDTESVVSDDDEPLPK